MTLRRKMALQITAMIVGLLLISAASLWGLNGLQQDYGEAVDGYKELRRVYQVGSEIAIAQTLLELPTPDRARAADHIQRGLTQLGNDLDLSPSHRGLRDGMRDVLAELRVAEEVGAPPTRAQDAVRDVLGQIKLTASDVRSRIEGNQAAALAKRRMTLTTLGLLCGVIILLAVVLGMWQYSGVLRPLNRLTGAVRRVARGQFGVRILEGRMPSGEDNEFARLASDFNRMAAQLDEFYRELEKKVAIKSKELIRSERLASVGYLAAGVAHEINNPLGIISGYAEYALAEIRNGNPEAAAKEIDATLRVIRDEAFRCKDITAKLLSLARPGDTQRHPVNLAGVAEQVVSVLAGLRDFKQRSITVRADAREPLVVNAVEGELKQVLMNLLLNALEATDDGNGEVRVLLTHGDDGRGTVVLSVSDNGRGMAPETLEHVFEPFFTDRRQRDPDGPAPRPGTGLGLSITHAIVQAHRGRITAHSDGLGRGSRFVIELPAASQPLPAGA